MITGELKSKVDRIWDTMWSGGISNPLSVIEQLTYLLFIKRLDEIQTLKENKAARADKLIQSTLAKAFRGELVPQNPNDQPAALLANAHNAQESSERMVAARRVRRVRERL